MPDVSLNLDDLAQLITTQEAAELTGYHYVHIRRLARLGHIKGMKVGRDWLLNRESVLAYFREMKARGPEKHNPHKETGEE